MSFSLVRWHSGSVIVLLIILALAGWQAWPYWARLGDDSWKARFSPWIIQGFVFPATVWSAVNLGFGDRFPALVPQIVEAQMASQPWLGIWAAYSLGGALTIGAHWLSITYAWMVVRIAARAEERRDFLATFAFFGFFAFGAAALFVYYYGWLYLGWVMAAALLPIVHFTADLAEHRDPVLSYGRAVANLKFGRYKQAEMDVISQLEKEDGDFDGWMMLAELYAKQYRNLEDAARVVHDICHDPRSRPCHIATACDRLADWQVEIAENPLGARAALELMIRKIPETHFARMAEQRLRRIPASVEAFDESRQRRRIRLPALREDTFEFGSPLPAKADGSALAEANRLSTILTENPDDILARQRLAVVLAEKLERVDLGVEQLRLLIGLPEPTDEHKARWSAEIAQWEFHRDRNTEKLRSALRAIIREYPQTSQAFAAQRQLSLLEWEVKHSPASEGTS